MENQSPYNSGALAWDINEVRKALAAAGVQVERLTDEEIQKTIRSFEIPLRGHKWATEAAYRSVVLEEVANRLDRYQFIWFKDAEHEFEYRRLLSRCKRDNDPYWNAFLYVITGAGKGQAAEKHLNFEEDRIPQELPELIGDLSGGAERMVRTAMHLWNESNPFAVAQDLRGLDTYNTQICLEAIRHLIKNIG